MTKLIIVIVSLFGFGCNVGNEDMQYDLVISNVNIIDVESGRTLREKDVHIRDSIIVKIAPANKHHPSEMIIDGTGKYLMPGLWDMHVHIQDSSYFQMFIDFGVVGVRDMGGCVDKPLNGCESLCPDVLQKWRRMIHQGKLQGPELFLAGNVLTGTGWPTSLRATSVEEVQESFEVLLNKQVDFVKVYEKIPADAYNEIARLCKTHNLDFVGHVSESLLLSQISDLGQKSVEHIREPILYSFTSDPDEMESFMIQSGYTKEDRDFVKPWIDDAENVIEAFKRNNTWFTPTMAVQFSRQRYNDTAWIYQSLRKELPASVNAGLAEHMARMRNSTDKKQDSLWWMALRRLVKRFNDEGIGLLAGTDIACEGGIPGFSLHEELWLMVEEAGLTPLQAIRTATINPCTYFGFQNRGKIAVGFIADAVLLDGNPLENIMNSRLVASTIRNGKVMRIQRRD